MISDILRKSVLKDAIFGKLTKQLVSDGLSIEQLEKSQFKYIVKEIDEENLIPNNWAYVKLKTLIKLTSGRDLIPSRYNNKGEGIPYITGASNFLNNKILVNRWTTDPQVISKKGDLLITVKGTIGLLNYNDIGDIHIARQIMAINSKIVNLDFVKYFLMYYVDTLNKQAKSFIPGISRNDILEINFPLPPSNEQKRIVEKLDELMPLIEELERQELELKDIEDKFPDKIKMSILEHAFTGDLIHEKIESKKFFNTNDEVGFEIPNHWEIKKLNKVSNINTGNSIPVAIKRNKYSKVTNGYPYIATKDLNNDGSFDYDNGVKIPYDEDFRIAKPYNSLMCVEGGSAGKKIGILDREVAYGNKLCSFEPLEISHKFLYYYLQSPIFQTQFKKSMTGIIDGVGINKIRNFIIPVPPVEEQVIIVDKLDQIFKEII